MKLEYRVLELADGHEWQCDFCVLDYDDLNNLALNTALATHEMVALDKKTGDYTDTAFICNECKQDFDSNVLPWCEKCGRTKRNRKRCFCHLEKDKSTQLVSEEDLMSRSFSYHLENKTRELEKELSTTKEELNIEREEVAKFQEKSEEWSKKQKQELLDKIKSLEEKINHLEEENRKLKDQQNGQLTAQIEVKETKRWSWLKIKK